MAPGAEPAGRVPHWHAVTATARGASHDLLGLPNQDAVTARERAPGELVAAVADGHGHSRHFRSGQGARLAVQAACDSVPELAPWLGTRPSAPEARDVLAPELVSRWRTAVQEDLAAQPFTATEEAQRAPGDGPLIAYGATLLLAVVWHEWLLLAQIGDGDILGIGVTGAALSPVPGDPLLNGLHTTSLCAPDAEQYFRTATVDLAAEPLLGLLLASDGYGNAQAEPQWQRAAGADLAELIRQQPPGWFAEQLPGWAERCASADGSGDDTTIALLIAPGPPEQSARS